MGTQLTRWDGLVTIATGILLFLWWMLVTTLLPSLAYSAKCLGEIAVPHQRTKSRGQNCDR